MNVCLELRVHGHGYPTVEDLTDGLSIGICLEEVCV